MLKAVTLYQPWASAAALGFKWIETRSWRTSYRGKLGIHAGLTTAAVGAPVWDAAADHVVMGGGSFYPLGFPNGVLLATCELLDCVPIVGEDRGVGRVVQNDDGLHLWPEKCVVDDPDISDQEPWGDFTPGRWAWLLGDVELLEEPVPMRGRQGLWTVAA